MLINSFDSLLVALKESEPFTFLRYGDGEMVYTERMDPHHRRTFAYQPWTEALSVDLQKTLAFPKRGVTYALGDAAERWRERWPIKWEKESILRDAVVNGEMERLFDVLEGRRVVVVGPPYLEAATFLHPAKLIPTLPRNAYMEKEKLLGEVLEDAAAHPRSVYLLSIAMLSEIIGYELHSYFRSSFLDCGSVWDALLGIPSRRWIKELTHAK